MEFAIIPLMKTCKFCSSEFESIYIKKIFCKRRCKELFYNKDQYIRLKEKRGFGSYEKGFCRICGIDCVNLQKSDKLCKNCYQIIFKRKEQGLSISKEDVLIDSHYRKTRPRRYLDKNGYVIILAKEHPNSKKNGRMREHIFIMSQYLGRPIKEKETIHHKNGIRDDNRIENLELWSHSHPYGQRVEDKIKWCIEFLKEYGYDISKR